MKKLFMFVMILALSVPVWAGEKTVTISRNEGIYEQGSGVYYCTKGGITMTFSSGLNNVNYLVEHQQVIFDIFSTNYTIKKIVFHCLDNTTDDNLDCFYWGPSTISLYSGGGSYSYDGYTGTWDGGAAGSKYIKFNTEAKPVRFASVDITFEKELGDIYDLVTSNSEIEEGQTYVLVSQRASKALSKEEYHGSDSYTTFSSTPVTLLNNNAKVKVTDEVQLLKLESSNYSSRPWYIKVGENYLRRRTTTSGSGTNTGYNLYTTSNIASGSESYYRASISVTGNTNNNALIRFDHNSSETSGGKTFAIRHYNGGSLFRDMDYSSNNSDASYQRVFLYKPAQNYAITTQCLPSDNDGYITLGDGVLVDNQGRQTSQQADTVKFFVGPTDGWGIGDVTVTNLTTSELTVLQPTATGDFGNDYEFVMPAANVHIVANFLPPYTIHTVVNPEQGGAFNFVSGYNDFNGQTTSNSGKVVTFTVEPEDNYYLSSVTYTDNETGETVTMTPDGNGVYSFVMPANDVTLEATFLVQPNELYLLGTSMGRISWCAAGPKFQFDGTNYYLDVYFKGGNENPSVDQAYGYFSLSKRIDTSIDWRTAASGAGDWGVMNGMRLAATSNNYLVGDGSTGVVLSGNNPDNAFKIPAGIYRITVSGDMSTMSIRQTPVTLTITPPSGYKKKGTVVNITSDVEEKVHAVAQIHGVNEDAQTIQYSLNGGTLATGTELTLTNEGQNTVYGQSNIGYIMATSTAVYNVVSDLYLLGWHNGASTFQLNGSALDFDNDTETYSITVYYKGRRDVPGEVDLTKGWFHFSTIQDNASSTDDVRHHYLVADYDDLNVVYYDEGGTPVMHNLSPFVSGGISAFEIEPGLYTIYVNGAKNQMWVMRHQFELDLEPGGGASAAEPTYVRYGQEVTAWSNLQDLIQAINPDEVNASFQVKQNGGDWTPGNITVITTPGITQVTGQSYIGYIVAEGDGYYAYTPLAYIEGSVDPEASVVVCDTLVGTWAVVKDGLKLLWAKDIGNKSIDKTFIIEGENGQKDYVTDMLKYQQHDWDQSNWVVLNFSGVADDPHDFVGIGIDPLSVKGYYDDGLNYNIVLSDNPTPLQDVQYPGYPGYVPDYLEANENIDYLYNHYIMANFMPYNLNAPYGDGFVAAEGSANSNLVGSRLFFMNPKAQEVAHVMGVWNDNDQFTVYTRDGVNNGYNFDGMIDVDWRYNRIGQSDYEVPVLKADTAYVFHMAIELIDNRSSNAVLGASAKPGTPSTRYRGYPLDLPGHDAIPTSVVELAPGKQVDSVRYYNIMGVESNEPFQGVNIVVTRYSDGSVSAVKILR